MKKLIFDVFYNEETKVAKAAALEFNEFTDVVESNSYIDKSIITSEYIPGEFYKREMPAIMSLINNVITPEKLKAEYDTIVIDGLYMLSRDHMGLGARLRQHLLDIGIDIEVIGIAKTHFHGCEEISTLVYRGLDSRKPLYVNGSAQRDYEKLVKSMYGDFRIPRLVKQVDKLCRM